MLEVKQFRGQHGLFLHGIVIYIGTKEQCNKMKTNSIFNKD